MKVLILRKFNSLTKSYSFFALENNHVLKTGKFNVQEEIEEEERAKVRASLAKMVEKEA